LLEENLNLPYYFAMKGTAKQTQRDECYLSLRRMLVHGQVQPGRRLTETAWSQQLGVTRGSLREAMSMLCHEGLLTRGKRGGFFTPVMTRQDYDDVLEVRFSIEVGALRLMSMKHLSGKNLPKMRETCDVMARMLEEDFELGFVEADRRFHELLVEAGQNARLVQVYSRAPLPFFVSMEPDRQRHRSQYQRTLDEHRRICELLEQGNYPKACEVLEKHLFAGRRLQKDDKNEIERNHQ
jgi:DNA-binding GntR family transcriptional regulator